MPDKLDENLLEPFWCISRQILHIAFLDNEAGRKFLSEDERFRVMKTRDEGEVPAQVGSKLEGF